MHLPARYALLKEVADLDEALSFYRQAIALLQPGHPDRSRSLGNFANVSYDEIRAAGGGARFAQGRSFARGSGLRRRSHRRSLIKCQNSVSTFYALGSPVLDERPFPPRDVFSQPGASPAAPHHKS